MKTRPICGPFTGSAEKKIGGTRTLKTMSHKHTIHARPLV